MLAGGSLAVRLSIDGTEREFAPEALVVIGYAGRDRAAVEHHIDELAELGVPRPASIPLFMVFPPWLMSQEPSITVAGSHTSGEAEIVMVVDGDEAFITIGSDHTDRVLEAVDIVASKGVCPKPVATAAWAAFWAGWPLGGSGAAQPHRRRGVPGRLRRREPAPAGARGGHPVGERSAPVLRGLHRHGARDRRHPPQRGLHRRAVRPGPAVAGAELSN